MAIVPYKLWEDMKRWKEEQIQKPRLPHDPNASAAASLQRDLSSVLANGDLSEDKKSQLYGQTLHQFQTAHRKALENNKLQLPESISSKINQRIMDSVPTTMKKKARLLMSMLQDHPNLSWDEDGTVKMYGQPIPGSNIIDLVNDVLRQRKGIEPTGWQPFAEGLKAMNVPQDFVGNKKRWEWMHRSKELDRPSSSPQEEEEDVFKTPLKSKKKRSHITPKRSIKKERFSAKRQLDPVAWSSNDE